MKIEDFSQNIRQEIPGPEAERVVGKGKFAREKNLATFNLARYVREFGKEAVDHIVDVMRDKTADPSTRVRCAQMILERGYGKPVTMLAAPDGGPIGINVAVAQLTDGELEKIATGHVVI